MATWIGRRARILAAALVVAGATGCGSVPNPVQQAFDQRYPTFDAATWEQQPYGWEAAFGGDDGTYEAEFDPAGQWLETEVEVVDAAGFPAAARRAVQDVAATGTVDKWEIEVTPTGEFYEVELAGSDGEYYFDATGRRVENRHEDA